MAEDSYIFNWKFHGIVILSLVFYSISCLRQYDIHKDSDDYGDEKAGDVKCNGACVDIESAQLRKTEAKDENQSDDG